MSTKTLKMLIKYLHFDYINLTNDFYRVSSTKKHRSRKKKKYFIKY